jgi:voltage-gated potassium channel Kch
LTTAGEFAFVVFPVAMAGGLLTATQAGLLSAITALTMIAGPLAAKALDVLAARIRPQGEALPAEEVPEEARGNILVIGFGRFGQLAVQVLLAGRANVTVIDVDIGRIRNAARFGFKVFYGDGNRLDVLRAAGAEQARVIAICIDKPEEATRILEICKANFPMARVHVRAFDRVHALKLLERRADYQMRETFESAIAFGGSVYAALSGDRERAAELAVHVRRLDNERLALQQAGAAYAELAPWQTIQPEPLMQPKQRAKPLSPETADIVGAAEKGS